MYFEDVGLWWRKGSGGVAPLGHGKRDGARRRQVPALAGTQETVGGYERSVATEAPRTPLCHQLHVQNLKKLKPALQQEKQGDAGNAYGQADDFFRANLFLVNQNFGD